MTSGKKPMTLDHLVDMLEEHIIDTRIDIKRLAEEVEKSGNVEMKRILEKNTEMMESIARDHDSIMHIRTGRESFKEEERKKSRILDIIEIRDIVDDVVLTDEAGTRLILAINRILKRSNIEEINALGRKYHPLHHEAVKIIDYPYVDRHTITEVMEAGYWDTESTRVIRRAKVTVSTGNGKKEEAKQEGGKAEGGKVEGGKAEGNKVEDDG